MLLIRKKLIQLLWGYHGDVVDEGERSKGNELKGRANIETPPCTRVAVRWVLNAAVFVRHVAGKMPRGGVWIRQRSITGEKRCYKCFL